MIWPRRLSTNEISGLAKSCKCPSGFAISPIRSLVQIRGDVESQNSGCRTAN